MSDHTNSTRILEYGRLFAVGFAGLLAILLLANIAPNFLSSSSRRAVINAPVTLVTSPISGRILEGPAISGQRFRAGDIVARVQNPTVDRNVLVQLSLQSLGVEERRAILRTEGEQQQQRVAELDSQIAALKPEVMLQLVASEGEARARLASTRAIATARQTQARRMQPLLDSKIITPLHVEVLKLQAAAAEADHAAAEHTFASKAAALEGAGRGAFIGEAFGLLNGLQQQRIAAATAMKRLATEQQAVEWRAGELRRLVEGETARLESLAEAVIVTPTDGYVLDVEQRQGQFVDAGKTILRMTTCNTALVTAVFPISMVGEVTLGATANVELLEAGRQVSGRVSRILPRESDRESEKLWVPLPPAQGNEIYVLVALDEDFSREAPNQDCNIGGWVRASIESRWQRSFAGVLRRVFSAADQSARHAGDVLPPVAHSVKATMGVMVLPDVPTLRAGR